MKCSKCGRTETARWYGKRTGSPYCCSCYRKEYVANNREKALATQRKSNSSEKSKQARREYRRSERGLEVKRQYDRRRYWEDPKAARKRKEKYQDPEYFKKHYQENKGYYTEKALRRRRDLDKASLGGKYKSEVVEIYETCPEGYEVDHIIPVKGYDFLDGERQQVVCGLHVPWNLQHLTKEENRKKSCNLY